MRNEEYRLDGTRPIQEYRLIIWETGTVLLTHNNLPYLKKLQENTTPRTSLQQLREHYNGQCHWEAVDEDDE